MSSRLVHCLLSGQPYFGTALRARQGVIERHRCFLSIIDAVRAKDRNVDVLEVGSWAGASAVTWARGLEARGLNGKVLCVDSWLPYFDTNLNRERVYADMNEAAASGDIFQLFIHNIKACGVQSRVEYRKGDSLSVLPALDDGLFDIVYLDGSHQYNQVIFDIEQAIRLVSTGGIICGDDLELQRDQLVEHEHRNAMTTVRDYVESKTNNCWYHPGVTEAVGERFGRVSAWSGFWAVRREANSWGTVELNVKNSNIPDHLQNPLDLDEAERETSPVSWILETSDHNIVRTGTRFVAVAKKLGSVELFHEQLGERELDNLILTASSLEEVRARADAAAAPMVSKIAETPKYNIVRAGDRFLAVAKTLGPVELFHERLGERDLGNLILTGSNLEEVCARAGASTTSTEPRVAETPD